MDCIWRLQTRQRQLKALGMPSHLFIDWDQDNIGLVKKGRKIRTGLVGSKGRLQTSAKVNAEVAISYSPSSALFSVSLHIS